MDSQNNLNSQPERVPAPDPLVPPAAPESPAPVVPDQQFATPVSDLPAAPSAPVTPMPVTVNPTVAPSPDVPPQPTVTVPAQPVQKKQSLLWLWIMIGVLSFLTIVAGLVLFVSKQSADQAANEYAKAATAYVKAIHDKVEASGTASDAKKDLDESIKQKPELKAVFFSSLSNDYAKAITLQKTVEVNVNEFTIGITELAGLDAYIDQNQENYAKLSAAISATNTSSSKSATLKAMDDVLVILKSAEASTNDAQFPAELADAKKDLIAAYKAEVANWGLMVVAANNNDSAAYSAAFAKFQAAADKESATFDDINEFYYELSTKRQELLEKLDSFYKDLV